LEGLAGGFDANYATQAQALGVRPNAGKRNRFLRCQFGDRPMEGATRAVIMGRDLGVRRLGRNRGQRSVSTEMKTTQFWQRQWALGAQSQSFFFCRSLGEPGANLDSTLSTPPLVIPAARNRTLSMGFIECQR
jgi:hypothetical protein